MVRAQHDFGVEWRLGEEVKALMVRVHEGDRDALPRMREVLNEACSLARKLMDPAKIAERSAASLYATEEDLVAREEVSNGVCTPARSMRSRR